MKTALLMIATFGCFSTAEARTVSVQDVACNQIWQNVERIQATRSAILNHSNPTGYIAALDRLEARINHTPSQQVPELHELRRIGPGISSAVLEYDDLIATRFLNNLDPQKLPAPSDLKLGLGSVLGAGGTLAVLGQIFFPQIMGSQDAMLAFYGLISAGGWFNFAKNAPAKAAQKRFANFIEYFKFKDAQIPRAITLRTRGETLRAAGAYGPGTTYRFVELTLIQYSYDGQKSLVIGVKAYNDGRLRYSDRGTTYIDPNFRNDYGSEKPGSSPVDFNLSSN